MGVGRSPVGFCGLFFLFLQDLARRRQEYSQNNHPNIEGPGPDRRIRSENECASIQCGGYHLWTFFVGPVSLSHGVGFHRSSVATSFYSEVGAGTHLFSVRVVKKAGVKGLNKVLSHTSEGHYLPLVDTPHYTETHTLGRGEKER